MISPKVITYVCLVSVGPGFALGTLYWLIYISRCINSIVNFFMLATESIHVEVKL